MTTEKMYTKDDDGCFTLNFPNKQALTDENIKQLFSQYGKVLSVRRAGDERGFRFVRYGTEEETVRAIKGFQGSKIIPLVPRRPKQKNQNNQNSQGSQSSQGSQGNQSKQHNQNNNKNISTNLSQNQKFSNKNYKSNDSINQHNSQSPIAESSRDGQIKANLGIKPLGSSHFKFKMTRKDSVNSISAFEQQKNTDELTFLNKNCERQAISTEAKKFTLHDHHTFDEMSTNLTKTLSQSHLPENEIQTVYCPKNIPSLLSLPMNGIPSHIRNFNDNMPSLIPVQEPLNKTDEVLQNLQKKQGETIVPAKEVIVANIHPQYGVGYILHLLERHDPISITLMKVVPHLSLRYCHVYFQSEKDALTVEQTYDKFNLCGLNLIVLRASRLIDEGNAF